MSYRLNILMSYLTFGHWDIGTFGYEDIRTFGLKDLRMQVPGKRPFDTSFGLLRDRFNSKKYTSSAVPELVEGRTHRNSIITETLNFQD